MLTFSEGLAGFLIENLLINTELICEFVVEGRIILFLMCFYVCIRNEFPVFKTFGEFSICQTFGQICAWLVSVHLPASPSHRK